MNADLMNKQGDSSVCRAERRCCGAMCWDRVDRSQLCGSCDGETSSCQTAEHTSPGYKYMNVGPTRNITHKRSCVITRMMLSRLAEYYKALKLHT